MTKRNISVLTLAITVLLVSIASVAVNPIQSVEAAIQGRVSNNCVPIGAFDDNVYLSWLSNKTGNYETMFRASNDSGKTFADKINISNATGSDSQDPNLAAYGDNVYVTWHDNKTGNWDTYVKTSKDKGQTFGNTIMINGTGNMPQTTKIGAY